MSRISLAPAWLAALALVSAPVWGQEAETTTAAAEESDPVADPSEAAWLAANVAMLHGPKTIPLRDQAQIALPEGYGFVPREQAVMVMEAMGNQADDRLIGLIFPLVEGKDWFVAVDFEPSGYIEDGEAKEWDADGLLDSLKKGTEMANEEREQRGIEPIKVTRWIEQPQYDAGVHHLVWSAEVRLRDGEDPDPGVNYNTYVLGREGYISMALVTAVSTVEADKPAAKELLGAVAFNEGKRYSDFNASTDKVAAYGLAALIGGVAAKKLGLLAVAAAFFAKFAKLIIVGVIALGAGVMKMFRGRSAAAE
jgi:uncharacterized membrane-anchored protein